MKKFSVFLAGFLLVSAVATAAPELRGAPPQAPVETNADGCIPLAIAISRVNAVQSITGVVMIDELDKIKALADLYNEMPGGRWDKRVDAALVLGHEGDQYGFLLIQFDVKAKMAYACAGAGITKPYAARFMNITGIRGMDTHDGSI